MRVVKQQYALFVTVAVMDAATPGAIPKSPSSVSVHGIDRLQSTTDEEMAIDDVDLEELQGNSSWRHNW